MYYTSTRRSIIVALLNIVVSEISIEICLKPFKERETFKRVPGEAKITLTSATYHSFTSSGFPVHDSPEIARTK